MAGARAAVAPGAPTSNRTFPLMFFNPVIAAADPPAKLQRRSWTVRATTRGDSSLLAASSDANRMLVLGLVAAATLAIGIGLSVRAARARLRLAELRADFVASVTHEFKTPIATIRAAGDTLVADRLDGAAARQDYARFIVHESRRLTRLVDNLLAFTRVTDTPEVRPPLEPVVLADVVAESLDRFAVQLSAGTFRVDVSVPPTLPPVLGDRTGLALMLDNLVDNVIRHSRGERALAIGASVSGRFVVLEVGDRGGGIPPDEVRHVTKKFYRGRLAGHGGTGLGLAIAARIVDDHRGTLNYRQRRRCRHNDADCDSGRAGAAGAGAAAPGGGRRPVVSTRMRILVVEDDHLLAKVVCDNLALDGFEVRRAADAHSAVNLGREFAPDLILLDVMLPDGSGFDVFETLHQGGRIPVIFLTARGETADKLRGLRLGRRRLRHQAVRSRRAPGTRPRGAAARARRRGPAHARRRGDRLQEPDRRARRRRIAPDPPGVRVAAVPGGEGRPRRPSRRAAARRVGLPG